MYPGVISGLIPLEVWRGIHPVPSAGVPETWVGENNTMTDYTCTMDADAWGLYSFDGYEHLRRAKRRGLSLSKRLTRLVVAAKAKLTKSPMLSEQKLAEKIRDTMYVLMNKYADDGARDTEPEGALVCELERAFELDEYSLER
jgi:hypothetical protein